VDAGLYEEHSGLVFESFDQEEDFFRGHQGNYLTDISRVLTYTGKRYNFYDVMVMALDPVVQREQIAIARARIQTLEGVSNQRRLKLRDVSEDVAAVPARPRANHQDPGPIKPANDFSPGRTLHHHWRLR